MKIIATGLTTVHAKDVIRFLKDYLSRENVECFVVGDPRNLDNTPSQAAGLVDAFIHLLKKNFPLIPIQREDERFTSKIAFRSMIEGGLKKKDRQRKELID